MTQPISPKIDPNDLPLEVLYKYLCRDYKKQKSHITQLEAKVVELEKVALTKQEYRRQLDLLMARINQQAMLIEELFTKEEMEDATHIVNGGMCRHNGKRIKKMFKKLDNLREENERMKSDIAAKQALISNLLIKLKQYEGKEDVK